jgi:anti-anti-sigma regulatory factor
MVAAPDLREQLHGLVNAGHARLVVDLSAVETSEQAMAVLELTNLNRVLQVADSPDSAFDDPI